MYCGKCGISNLERAKFCRECGADMSFERNRGKFGKGFFITISCAMLVLIAVSLIYFAVKENIVEQKLNNEIQFVYNKM